MTETVLPARPARISPAEALADYRTGWLSRHASLLGPTYPNREYLLSGQSGGNKSNVFPTGDGFPWDTIVDRLGLRDRLRHRPSELSGGQQQRVAAARAMLTRPELIFADEPTGNLDSRSATELLDSARASVDGFGQTIVMVTHDPRAASYADRVVFLSDGRIVDELARPSVELILDTLKQLGR